LPPGDYVVGLSERERQAAYRISSQPQWSVNELTPTLNVRIDSSFVAELPVSCSIARNAGLSVNGEDRAPAMLTFDEVEVVCSVFGWRPVSEAEWEVCCRGGQQGLFAWGDDLPSQVVLGEWLSWDMGDPRSPRNDWGFGSIYFGEWCADQFLVPRNAIGRSADGARVIKGGGAQFWPWQTGEEWVWCLAAMRMPSSDLFADGRAAFRPGLRASDIGRLKPPSTARTIETGA